MYLVRWSVVVMVEGHGQQSGQRAEEGTVLERTRIGAVYSAHLHTQKSASFIQ